ncbi:MAG TPA: acyloxyacyl hydrolase [Geminicoccaceae bacterium]|nr:acyloxyacyl hydrolase [Geminicoccaceae bacterium]
MERLVAAVRAEPAGGLAGIVPQETPRPDRGRDLGLAVGLAAALCIVGTAAADEVLGHIGPVRLLGEGPNRLLIGAGVFDAFDESRYGLDGDRSLAANIDLRAGRKLFGLGPAVGATANVNGGVFGYAGLYADLAIADFVVSPLIGAGAYRRGDSKDLGGTFAVRVELGVAHQFANEARLGVRWGHVSNAYTYQQNPTEEEYLITYAWPF